jgi:hypothetical protein
MATLEPNPAFTTVELLALKRIAEGKVHRGTGSRNTTLPCWHGSLVRQASLSCPRSIMGEGLFSLTAQLRSTPSTPRDGRRLLAFSPCPWPSSTMTAEHRPRALIS